jgi:hypothetical protein
MCVSEKSTQKFSSVLLSAAKILGLHARLAPAMIERIKNFRLEMGGR